MRSTDGISSHHSVVSSGYTAGIHPERRSPCLTEIDFYKWDEDYTDHGITGWWINTKDDSGNWNTSF
ncbi:MAG: hypothetical protein U5Q03_11805 [Bacteroidota bacterium]|nr:hypothetical protein [Bacteroidota bacterium]